MEIQDFIKNFANQFEETEFSEFTPDTLYRDLDEWSSLVTLAVMNMIGKKYGVLLNINDMRSTHTIQELFDLVKSKM